MHDLVTDQELDVLPLIRELTALRHVLFTVLTLTSLDALQVSKVKQRLAEIFVEDKRAVIGSACGFNIRKALFVAFI